MGLASEGPVAILVLLNKPIEDGMGFMLVEALLDQHPDHPFFEVSKRFRRSLGCHGGDHHKQRRSGHIVASGALGLSVGITKLLLSLSLFGCGSPRTSLACTLPRQVSGYRCQTAVATATPFAWNRKSRFMNRFIGVLNRMIAI